MCRRPSHFLFHRAGIAVREDFGTIRSFEKTPSGVRMVFSKEDTRDTVLRPRHDHSAQWVEDVSHSGHRAQIWRGRRQGVVRKTMCVLGLLATGFRTTRATPRAASPVA